MTLYGLVIQAARHELTSSCRPHLARPTTTQRVRLHTKARQRRDDFWSPKVQLESEHGSNDATTLLVRAGFVRQAYAGIYHFLPLGLRVLEKLERLVDKHMRSVGASKVSLSSLSSQKLWERSGRLEHGSELLKLEDGKRVKWLLTPTHEEEITILVQKSVSTPGDLPVRLYQVGRKYRDEKRPRGGLLRGKEFIMKDLYTFDSTVEDAHKTYHQVREAYTSFFGDLRIPFVEARADSGNMGGKLSHEYHLPNAAGEDTIIACSQCDHSKNEEFVPPVSTKFEPLDLDHTRSIESSSSAPVRRHFYVSKDRKALVVVRIPSVKDDQKASRSMVNTHVVKAIMSGEAEINTGIEEDAALKEFSEKQHQDSAPGTLYYISDKATDEASLEHQAISDWKTLDLPPGRTFVVKSATVDQNPSEEGASLLRAQDGDMCPQCKSASITVRQAIEVGHTFHLGTRYSRDFDFKVPLAKAPSESDQRPFVEMGCHGIGVSRLIAATAACLSENDRLRWPRVIAPFEVVLITKLGAVYWESQATAHAIYDALQDSEAGEVVDVLLDDRPTGVGYKIYDAIYIGYPIRVILAKALARGKVEILCDALSVKEDVDVKEAAGFIRGLLARL